MSIMHDIAQRQPPYKHTGSEQFPDELPKHNPEMLFIGCVDARLDPVQDLGIDKGKALITRSIAALIPPHRTLDGEVLPEASSVAATLEFFIKNFPSPEDGVKHIVVAGHTDCGGLKACKNGCGTEYEHLPNYIHLLDEVRETVMAKAKAEGWNDEEILQELERESVRHSIGNLMHYPVVAEAVENGTVQLHGWVLDTATKRIHEMHPETQKFQPMRPQVSLESNIKLGGR